jgi:hypothetical protein
MLNQFFRAAVQQSDMRIYALNNLTIQIQNQAQDAMRRRVLRSEVNRKFTVF